MTAPVLPGAEPYAYDIPATTEAIGGAGASRVGVLLCHGFTGSPQSMRPWGEHLAAAGFGVRVPRLPGHGTHWKDMQLTTWDDWYHEVDRSFAELKAAYDTVFVTGLSMGGTLALRLAERHGSDIAGVVLVNASVKADQAAIRFVPAIKHLVRTVPGIGNAVKKEGVTELAYDRVPLKALASLAKGWKTVQADLPKVTQPLLLLRSTVDPVVHSSNSEAILARISSTDVTERILTDSSHVATIDNDAELIFEESVGFIRRIAELKD